MQMRGHKGAGKKMQKCLDVIELFGKINFHCKRRHLNHHITIKLFDINKCFLHLPQIELLIIGKHSPSTILYH